MVGRLADGAGAQTPIPNPEKSNNDKEVVNQTLNNVGTLTQQSGWEQDLPIEKAKKLTDSLNKVLETSATELRFEFHDELKEYYVTIVNSNKEVIREIPSKKLMDVFAAMQKFVGILVDRKI